MKIKEGFILRQVGQSNVIVAVGEASKDFNGIITLNETGKFFWECLQKGQDQEDIVKSVLNEYDVEEGKAREDVAKFLGKLKEAKIIDD